MKKIIYFIVGVLLASIITSCFSAGGIAMKPISGASSFYLDNADLDSLKEEALNGNARAAFRVYQHYAMGKGDIISSFPWLQIAATGNDVEAQYIMGYTYLHVDLFKNIPLARFWLNEALKNGSINAKELLEKEKI